MGLVTESEFKGNSMLVLKRDASDRFPFQFGLSKAELILDCVDEIRAWVAKEKAKKQARSDKVDAMMGRQ